jgi:hypothetical protein
LAAPTTRDTGRKDSAHTTELLDRYLPKTAPAYLVLNSKDPRRAIEYWRSALQILVDNQFLARAGEAARTLDDMRQDLPRQDWQDQWLDEAVDLKPGVRMQDAVQACADALPVPFHVHSVQP